MHLKPKDSVYQWTTANLSPDLVWAKPTGYVMIGEVTFNAQKQGYMYGIGLQADGATHGRMALVTTDGKY